MNKYEKAFASLNGESPKKKDYKLIKYLVEKETPKKTIKISNLVGKYCPTCGSHLTVSLNPRRNLRCYFCGQLFGLD